MVDKIRIGEKESLRSGAKKINDSIEQSNQAIEKANNANQKSDQALSNSESTQEQLDQVVIEIGRAHV